MPAHAGHHRRLCHAQIYKHHMETLFSVSAFPLCLKYSSHSQTWLSDLNCLCTIVLRLDLNHPCMLCALFEAKFQPRKPHALTCWPAVGSHAWHLTTD